MGRFSKVCDWSFTWSPETGCEKVPENWEAFFESDGVTRCIAVAEFAEKWHIHAAFTTAREFNSDYKWWEKAAKDFGQERPALEIRHHSDIFGLAGGYLQKETDTKILFRKGFTDEQLRYGVERHERGLRRKRVRGFMDRYVNIHPDKIEVAIGAQMAELECDRNTAVVELAKDGFAFGRSSTTRGVDPAQIYARDYKRQKMVAKDDA